MVPTFYYTLHPSDFARHRLVPGARAMLVASSLWDGSRLRCRRPPADVLTSLVLDSGGFTAARKWGQYPWDARHYARWGQRYQAGPLPLDWLAVLDYACEHGVNREVHATNRARIDATVTNAARCRDAAPDLPWLPVLQGYTLAEYQQCQAAYVAAGWDLRSCGLGTVCGRPVREARALLRQLGQAFPGQRYHVFGMHLGVLDDVLATAQVQSWDSYAWNWGTGGKDDPCRLRRRPGESYSRYTGRLALAYQQRIDRRLQQLPLPLAGTEG